jgi:hypothetical protein
MGDIGGERVCASCGKRAAADALVEVDDEHYQCEACHDSVLTDGLIEERAAVGDDTITRPIGDPDEAAHRRGEAA